MNNTQQILLNSSPEVLLKKLKELQATDIASLETILVLLWQIHPDEKVQQEAQQLLTSSISPEQEESLKTIFAIFQSVTDFLPWMGDYKALQQSNYQNFQVAS